MTNKNITMFSDLSHIHGSVVSALKRVFSRSPLVIDFLKKNRREEIWHKKNGMQAQKKHVFYTCAYCKQEFNSNQVQVDHIEPVIPLNIPSKHLSYDTMIKRLFCDESNLQILCKAHHKEKSQKENATRKEWLIKTKYIVYETTNRINNKRYIGVHKCEDYDDCYLGSGKLLKIAINKYGINNFYRHIMFVYDNAEEAYNKEKELVTVELINSEDYYNLAIGGCGNIHDTYHNEVNKKKLICHQTGEIFESVTAAAEYINISASSISKAINNPNQPVKNLHFFTLDQYDSNIYVTFPQIGRKVIYLNNKKIYLSIKSAAEDLNLNFKSLCNALAEKTSDEIYSLDNNYFLYYDEYDENQQYSITKRKIRCIELNKIFNTLLEAAIFLKHENPKMGSIGIGTAIRECKKMYKYTWEYVYETISLPFESIDKLSK